MYKYNGYKLLFSFVSLLYNFIFDKKMSGKYKFNKESLYCVSIRGYF